MLKVKESFTIATLLLLIACSNSLWDELPDSISTFISTYYPMSGISKYTETENGEYHVTIKNGATMVFGSDYQWITVNGNGVPLPVIFVTDKLPENLVKYLTELEMTGSVYVAQNDPRSVELTMHDFKIHYVKETGQITQTD